MNRIPSAFLIFLFLSTSCTVKENRQECPCDLTVMSDGILNEGYRGNLVLSIFNNQMNLNTLYRRPLALEDFLSGNCTYQVPKGWLDVSVVGGTTGDMAFDRDTLLLIPAGCQCDSIYAFSADCYAYEYDDAKVVKGPLNKQFCTISITARDERGEALDAEMKLRGHSDGINILSLGPHTGNFVYDIPEPVSGCYSARVPRQADASLELLVQVPGAISDVVPIGKLIMDSGYSWGTLSLGDVSVSLVYSDLGLSVFVCDWENKEIEI